MSVDNRAGQRGGFAELLFGEWAAGEPERAALRVAQATWTYAALVRQIERAARRFAGAGVGPGDRVLVVSANAPELLIAVLAVMSIDAIAVPVSQDVGPQRLRYVIDLVDPSLCVLAADAPSPPCGPPLVRVTRDPGQAEVRFDPPAAEAAAAPRGDEADPPAMILLSSGSTGRPKAVVLRRDGLLWTARTLATVFGFGSSHRELIVSPLSHSGAWQRAAATLGAGGCVVISTGPVTISGILEDCAAFGINGFYTPPPLVRYLLKSAPHKVRAALQTCRSIEIGSAPLAAAELRQLLALTDPARIFVHYGLTECSRGVILDARAHPDKLGTVGAACPGSELAVCDAAGGPLGAGRRGGIRLRGPQRADSYWKQPELTRERIVAGWIVTGDHGQVDEDGFLTFLGREDDMITSAGYSFFPAEVETELGEVPGVEGYVIAGLPDPKGILGEVPCAFVQPSDPQAWSAGELLRVARERLPAYMIPKRIIAVPDLPRSASGKSDRRRTVQLYGAPEAE